MRRLAALVCVLAGCGLFAAPARATKYVALGDSYSSGTGTRTYYEPGCQRSIDSYPYLLHRAHPRWSFVQAACSGATTDSLLSSQIASVTSDTDWVSYTIGGNDAGFSSVITRCAQPSWSSDCDGAIDGARAFIRATLPERLELVNEAIRARAPSARVVVFDYPRLFDGIDCNAFTWFSGVEMERLNRTANLLRGVISAASRRAGTGFLFRDVIPAFTGHAICDGGSSSQTEWINGLSSPLGESFHPNVRGQGGGYYALIHGTTG